MSRAVVFAYHNVGVRCLSVLLAHGVKIPLVVTHTDNPDENIWFGSVAELAALHAWALGRIEEAHGNWQSRHRREDSLEVGALDR